MTEEMMLQVDVGMARTEGGRHVAVGRLLSGVALLTIASCIARVGFAGIVASQAWGEASQAAGLVFLLRFGEKRRTTSPEVVVSIFLGATVGALAALVRVWSATVLTIAVAMILIHHPCPSKSQFSADHANTPSLGFWQLLLATFWFVHRSAAGSGGKTCLCAAFAHSVLLVAAVELGDLLSVPAQRPDGGGALRAGERDAEEVPGPRSVGAAADSPSAWAARGHGAPSPWRSGTRSPRVGNAAAAGAFGAASRQRSIAEGGELEWGQHLPPFPPRGKDYPGGAGGGGDSTLTTRASCPAVSYLRGPGASLMRSASAAAFGGSWNGGSGDGNVAGGAAAAAAAARRSLYVMAASPLRWSTGQSRARPPPSPPAIPAVSAPGCCDEDAIGSRREGAEVEDALAEGFSPDGQSPTQGRQKQQQCQRFPRPWECESRSSPRTPTGHEVQVAAAAATGAAAEARAAAEAEAAEAATPTPREHKVGGGDGRAGPAAPCSPTGDVSEGSHEDAGGTSDDGADTNGGRELATPSDEELSSRLQQRPQPDQWGQQEPRGDAEGELGGLRVWGDPRVAVGDGQQCVRYRRETGASTHDYILLQSTLPGTDIAAPYESGFSTDDEGVEDDDDDVDDIGDDDDDDDDEYDSEPYLDDDNDEDDDNVDNGASDGCFSLVVDNTGAPLDDCMVGVNRLAQRTHGSFSQHKAQIVAAGHVDEAAAGVLAVGVCDGVATAEGLQGPAHMGEPAPGVRAHVRASRGAERRKSPTRRHRQGYAALNCSAPWDGALECNPLQNAVGPGPSAAFAEVITVHDGDGWRSSHVPRGAAAPPLEMPRWHHARRMPAAVPQLVPNPYGCDVADLADLEDLMSLEEAEACAAGLTVGAASTKVAQTAGIHRSSCTAAVGGSEDPYSFSHKGNSAQASETWWIGVRQQQQQLLLQQAQLNGLKQQLGSCGDVGSADTVGCRVWVNGTGRQAAAVAAEPLAQLTVPGAGLQQDAAEELPPSSVPLEERTLAQHLAAERALDLRRKVEVQLQLQQLRSQLQQQQQQESLCTAGADRGAPGGSGGTPQGLGEAAFPLSASPELMICFLREVEMLACADGGHTGDGCRAEDLLYGTEDGMVDRDGADGDGGAMVRQGVSVTAAENEAALPVHGSHEHRHAAKSRLRARHHDSHVRVVCNEPVMQPCQQLLYEQAYEHQQRRHEQLAEAVAASGGRSKRTRARGRRRHVRKLSEGQLHARQVYGLEYWYEHGYEDPYGHEAVPLEYTAHALPHGVAGLSRRRHQVLAVELEPPPSERQGGRLQRRSSMKRAGGVPAEADGALVDEHDHGRGYLGGGGTVGAPDDAWLPPPREPAAHQRLQGLSRNAACAAQWVTAPAAAGVGGSTEPVCPVESDLPWADDLQAYELSTSDVQQQQLMLLQHQQQEQLWGPAGEGQLVSMAASACTPGRMSSFVGPSGRPLTPVVSSGPAAWGAAGASANAATIGLPRSPDWTGGAGMRNGGSWGGVVGGAAGIAAATVARPPTAGAMMGSPQQLRCASSPMAAAAAPSAASAPPTPPAATVVEPFAAAGQAVYRSLSGTRRYEEADRRRGISDNYKAALAAAAAAASGTRSRPTTPPTGSQPPELQPPQPAPPPAVAATAASAFAASAVPLSGCAGAPAAAAADAHHSDSPSALAATGPPDLREARSRQPTVLIVVDPPDASRAPDRAGDRPGVDDLGRGSAGCRSTAETHGVPTALPLASERSSECLAAVAAVALVSTRSVAESAGGEGQLLAAPAPEVLDGRKVVEGDAAAPGSGGDAEPGMLPGRCCGAC